MRAARYKSDHLSSSRVYQIRDITEYNYLQIIGHHTKTAYEVTLTSATTQRWSGDRYEVSEDGNVLVSAPTWEELVKELNDYDHDIFNRHSH